jgi:hypothetical protein
MNQPRLGFPVGVNAVGGFAQQQRRARVISKGGLGSGEQRPGGRLSLPILRRSLLDDRHDRCDQSEDEQGRQDPDAAPSAASIVSKAAEEKVASLRAQLDTV